MRSSDNKEGRSCRAAAWKRLLRMKGDGGSGLAGRESGRVRRILGRRGKFSRRVRAESTVVRRKVDDSRAGNPNRSVGRYEDPGLDWGHGFDVWASSGAINVVMLGGGAVHSGVIDILRDGQPMVCTCRLDSPHQGSLPRVKMATDSSYAGIGQQVTLQSGK
jgi:hypothetical protein